MKFESRWLGWWCGVWEEGFIVVCDCNFVTYKQISSSVLMSMSHQKHPSTSPTSSLRPNPIPGLSLSAATETKLQVVEVLQVTPSLLCAINSGALLPPADEYFEKSVHPSPSRLCIHRSISISSGLYVNFHALYKYRGARNRKSGRGMQNQNKADWKKWSFLRRWVTE